MRLLRKIPKFIFLYFCLTTRYENCTSSAKPLENKAKKSRSFNNMWNNKNGDFEKSTFVLDVHLNNNNNNHHHHHHHRKIIALT